MKRFLSLSMTAIFLAGGPAQATRPEAGVWWEIVPGRSIDVRLQIEAGTDGLRIISAPLASAPVSWGSITTTDNGSIQFYRAGDPLQPCTLTRSEFGTYRGSCRGPIAGELTLARHGNPGGLELAVSDTDLEILAKAREILYGPAVWNRHDDRVCDDSRAKRSWSLYCALDQASVDVTRSDLHVRPVMEEARAAIVEVAGRSFQRSLMDFNNLESTTYSDVSKVFDRTEERLRTMKACLQGSDVRMPRNSPADARIGPRLVHYWGESIGYTVNGQTFELTNVLSPMDQRGEVPEGWVAASTAVQRRTLPDDPRHPIDATGTLQNGHRWRYAGLCGEALVYDDASAQAAAYFDKLIDGVYFRKFKTIR